MLTLGVGIFPPPTLRLTYFYFDALENPQTFLFHRHTLPPVRLLFPLDDYMKMVLHGGRLWPLQRADNPEVLHIYALWTAIVLRVLPAAVAAGLARRSRRALDRAAAAGGSGGVATCAAPPTHKGMEGNPRHSAEEKRG